MNKSCKTLSGEEARCLVDTYYQMQENRKRAENQVRALSASNKPCETLVLISKEARQFENNVRGILDSYSAAQELGRWARKTLGIGPVIAAGLLAHIDVGRAVTAGAVWRFAGQDPSSTWAKGQKRPWNAALKTLCWKIGESFVKVSGNKNAFYGKLYVERKIREIEKNDAGEFKEQAKTGAERVSKNTEAYKYYSKGKLPPAHIHARAKRYAVKIFLSHYWETGRRLLGLEIVKPFAIEHLGHIHKIEP